MELEDNSDAKDYVPHYYGNIIRLIFVISGLIMAISFPFFSKLINLPLPIAIFAVLVLAILGGLINPKQKWVILLNAIAPMIAFCTFEYYAVSTYLNYVPNSIDISFFWINQILALMFFVATYLEIKTLRAIYSK